MCFSAEASFVVGGALVSRRRVLHLRGQRSRSRATSGLAVVPLCFGIQQISEGLRLARARIMVIPWRHARRHWCFLFFRAGILAVVGFSTGDGIDGAIAVGRRWGLLGLAVLTTVCGSGFCTTRC